MPTRTATLIRQPSTPDGVLGDWVSDSGFACKTIEKPWMGDETDLSCVPPSPGDTPVKYLVLWQYSNKHKCNLYHLQNVPNRLAIEIHSANLQVQLQGCIAPGAAIATFAANSISDGVPEVDSKGVTASRQTLGALEADMRDAKTGEQMPFWLTIQEASQS